MNIKAIVLALGSLTIVACSAAPESVESSRGESTTRLNNVRFTPEQIQHLGGDRPTEITVPWSAIESVDETLGDRKPQGERVYCCKSCICETTGGCHCGACGDIC